MSVEGREGYDFACPGCEEQLEINKRMRDTLIERGCVICGTPVAEEAFSEDALVD
jgi:Zn ribbon nucleic-acid-binding protein